MKNIEGRSAKSIRNVATGVGNKMLIMLLAFSTRTIFIRLLGAEYNGVNSLYTNILSVLSLAEMGMGNVLMFYLYGALKQRDEKTIAGLVGLFKRIYSIIIIVVLTVGILLVPFLRFIVKSELDGKELILYYLLYLTNSVATYFVVYRTTVLSADQKTYISNIVHTIMIVVMYILQIVYLLLFKNFFGYLLIQVLCTIGTNIILNHIALKHYPFLKTKNDSLIKPSINTKDIYRNISATFLFKVSDTILDQTDSIIISIMFGTVLVGYYSNYYMLISYIVAIAGIIANGLVASFGNLNAEGDMKRSYEMFRVALIAFAMFGTIWTTCYACIVQDFVPVWVGSEYLMPYGLVVAVLAVFYLRMITNTMWMYRSAMGIFREVQYINLAAAALNIVLSVVLGTYIGVAGVIVATAVSRVVTSFWYEARVVFKKFDQPLRVYFGLQFKNLIICVVSVLISLFLCSYVAGNKYIVLVLKLIVALGVSALCIILFYSRTVEYRVMKEKLFGVFRPKKTQTDDANKSVGPQ